MNRIDLVALLSLILSATPAAAQDQLQTLEATWGAACVSDDCPAPLPLKADAANPATKANDEQPYATVDSVYPEPEVEPLSLDLVVTPKAVVPGEKFSVILKSDTDCELWLVDQSPEPGVPAAILTPDHPAYSSFVGEEVLKAGQSRILSFPADNNPGENTISALCFTGDAGSLGLAPKHIQNQLAGYQAQYGTEYGEQLSSQIQRALPADRVAMVVGKLVIKSATSY